MGERIVVLHITLRIARTVPYTGAGLRQPP